ncbi:MAG TPA: sugar ABC transporter substrate-binding protein [Firmicutes bacterium]|jgi:multiple sugar transport system substrate-binding protein|nr:sugar ABC transporter substrate-binding protein [Bacillota bacterium]
MKCKSERVKKYIVYSSVLSLAAVLLFIYIYHRITQPVVLEFGVFAGSNWDVPNGKSYEITDEAIANFEALHPGVKIKYRCGTLKSDYSEWLAQKIIQGKEPDVFCILAEDFNTLSALGILENLDTLIKSDSEFDISKMYVNAIKSGQFQGSQYALPREVVPVLMNVNETLLRKEGIPVPKADWTWDDFYNICRKVTRDVNGDGILDQFGVVGFNWQDAVYTNGQQLFDANGTKAMFDKPGVLEAIRFVSKLNQLNANRRVTMDDFDDGHVAFRPFPFSSYLTYKTYPYRLIHYAQFNWECIPLPRGPHGKNASALHSLLIGISSRSKHPKEAWEFLKFLTFNRGCQLSVFKYSPAVPVLREVTESKAADQELAGDNPYEALSVDKKVLSQVIEESTVTPRFHKYEEAMNMADKEIFRFINEDMDIEDAMSKLNNDLTKFLQQ